MDMAFFSRFSGMKSGVPYPPVQEVRVFIGRPYHMYLPKFLIVVWNSKVSASNVVSSMENSRNWRLSNTQNKEWKIAQRTLCL